MRLFTLFSASQSSGWFCTLILLLSITCGQGIAQEVVLPAKENFHLFLLVGQSNMAGRGVVESQDKTAHPRVLMLNKQSVWEPAIDPLHFDKPVAGVGLGKTFAQIVADANPEIVVGLIPCAVGGSPISTWQPGAFYSATKSHPWDDAIKRTTKALESGTLRGILWHQGESDSGDLQNANAYEKRLHELIVRFRKQLDAPDVPFIAGQLGQFAEVPWTQARTVVNAAHQSLPSKIPHTAFVASNDLQHKGDKVHFDSASCREFGRRYAEAYFKLLQAK